MHRLVEVGSWDAVEGDVSPQLVPEVRGFQQQIKRDGVHRVAKKGVLHHDCPPASTVGAGKECFLYVLTGSQVVPLGGTQKLVAHLRVWPSYENGSWQVINYDYSIIPPPA